MGGGSDTQSASVSACVSVCVCVCACVCMKEGVRVGGGSDTVSKCVLV